MRRRRWTTARRVGEDSGANAIAVLDNDTDIDGGPKSVASATDPANGTVVITGGGTGLTYQPDPDYCNEPGPAAPDTFDYTLNGGSDATVSVTVDCVDDAATAMNDSATVTEDSGANAIDVLANDTDGDGGPRTISSASDPANGTVVITGGGSGLTYEPDANYCNDHAGGTSDLFTYTLNGGSVATVTVTVECEADDPTVDTSAGDTSYTENAPATPIDSDVNVGDVDPGATITGATVRITGGYAGAEDVLALASPGSHPDISPSVSGDTLTLSGAAGPAAYQAALRDVTYRNSSETPSTSARTITFTVTDETARTGSDTKGVTVVPVDDPPTAVNDSATVLEDAAATGIPVLTNDTDIDGGPKTVGSASDPANGTVVITGGGTGLTYQPDPNYCNEPPGTTPDTFTYTLNGGSSATVSMTVTCVNDAPVADDETFDGSDSAHGNTAMLVDDPSDVAPDPSHPNSTVTGDILAGDTDIDGPGPLTVRVPAGGMIATNDGGSVTIEADGDFTYHPKAVTSCTDTSDFFDYTVEDNGSPSLTGTGRVTIAIAGCVWYVDNDAPGDSGTSAEPFDTLAQAESASGSNHTVFVFDGDDTSTGYHTGFAMNAGERLIGEHEGLQVGGDDLHPPNADAHPTLTALNEDVVALSTGNEVRGITIDPDGTSGGIVGASGDTGVTIDDVNIADNGTVATEPGLDLDTMTGTSTVSNLDVDTRSTGVRIHDAGSVSFTPAGDISITANGGPGLLASDTSMGTSTFDDMTVTNSTGGGLTLLNLTGTTNIGDGAGTDLDVTTTGGSAIAADAVQNLTVDAAGTDVVHASGGPAVDVRNSSGAVLHFEDADSSGSATDGVNLDALGSGTFSAGSASTISGAAGIAFDVNGGSGSVDFDGTIANGEGTTADVTNRNGNTSLDGPITDTGDVDGTQETAINLSGNGGGAVTSITNATKTLSTFEDHAIVMTGSDNHTLNATGGGLQINTTAGKGLEADASGTLTVTGSGNTINTTTGRALHVSNTDIGAADLTFRQVASNGAPNGIRLNATGSSGGLSVTGTGASRRPAARSTARRPRASS